ncbi:hypothetical protein BURPS1710b_A1027 [Burkholderia pseudomallei 1710b]|uniref:Uncharacterized protein n=1 Tax=Burkholderia pseudomallei (strain 1710b) TaxID=320372 RepID=Q3JJR8_BURP1|nr:hypothetical protein BURPS1710b_A1027 [Burkholderia pseudomallei 1710b]
MRAARSERAVSQGARRPAAELHRRVRAVRTAGIRRSRDRHHAAVGRRRCGDVARAPDRALRRPPCRLNARSTGSGVCSASCASGASINDATGICSSPSCAAPTRTGAARATRLPVTTVARRTANTAGCVSAMFRAPAPTHPRSVSTSAAARALRRPTHGRITEGAWHDACSNRRGHRHAHRRRSSPPRADDSAAALRQPRAAAAAESQFAVLFAISAAHRRLHAAVAAVRRSRRRPRVFPARRRHRRPAGGEHGQVARRRVRSGRDLRRASARAAQRPPHRLGAAAARGRARRRARRDGQVARQRALRRRADDAVSGHAVPERRARSARAGRVDEPRDHSRFRYAAQRAGVGGRASRGRCPDRAPSAARADDSLRGFPVGSGAHVAARMRVLRHRFPAADARHREFAGGAAYLAHVRAVGVELFRADRRECGQVQAAAIDCRDRDDRDARARIHATLRLSADDRRDRDARRVRRRRRAPPLRRAATARMARARAVEFP